MSQKITREEARKKILLGERLYFEGVNFDDSVLDKVDLEQEYMEQSFLLFDWNHETVENKKLPSGYRIDGGTFTQLIWDQKSDYHIVSRGDKFFVTYKDEVLAPIAFEKKPKFYQSTTKNGTKMSTIGQYYGDGELFVIYSNECTLRDQGLSCQFCNINATKDHFAERDHIQWKDAKQIAETARAAYDLDGYKHITISGGFVPERREVDYYVDIADELAEVFDEKDDFKFSACVGAPSDLSAIEKYKEAGYHTIATNLEIWDENLFKVICPGKEKLCGGHQHWIDTLLEEVQVFGKGNVRSCLVGGIECKESLLEGVEFLADHGIVPAVSPWDPNPGSILEGHRAPTVEWFHEVNEKIYHIMKKYFTHEQYYYANASAYNIFNTYYELDGDHIPWFQSEKIEVIG
jgi:hypothetical protein